VGTQREPLLLPLSNIPHDKPMILQQQSHQEEAKHDDYLAHVL
jgi:hypothetical protein